MKKALSTFTKKDLRRGDYYPMFCKLMDKGCEIEAYLFILATWNSGGFRYAMYEFDVDAFKVKVNKLAPFFEKMNTEDFASMDIDKYSMGIKKIFKTFGDIKGIKSTGASKLMHLKLPRVFVMWDRHIRIAYRYKNGNPDDYVCFLKKMQKKFSRCKVPAGRTLAKAIDEHNYKKYSMPALEKNRKKREGKNK